MFKTIVSFAALLAVTLVAAPARAQAKGDPDLKLEWEVPAGWKGEVQGNTTILEDPKGETTIMLVKTGDKDAEQVMAGIDQVLGATIKDLKYEDKPTTGQTNGLRSIQQRLTGKLDGKPVKGIMRLLEAPEKRYLVIVAVALTDKYETLRGPINAFLKSVKPQKK
jgi:hypothetical protein